MLSEDDITMVQNEPATSTLGTWRTWREDPIKRAVVKALNHWDVPSRDFLAPIVYALAQNWVCFIHPYSLGVEEVHC